MQCPAPEDSSLSYLDTSMRTRSLSPTASQHTHVDQSKRLGNLWRMDAVSCQEESCAWDAHQNPRPSCWWLQMDSPCPKAAPTMF